MKSPSGHISTIAAAFVATASGRFSSYEDRIPDVRQPSHRQIDRVGKATVRVPEWRSPQSRRQDIPFGTAHRVAMLIEQSHAHRCDSKESCRIRSKAVSAGARRQCSKRTSARSSGYRKSRRSSGERGSRSRLGLSAGRAQVATNRRREWGGREQQRQNRQSDSCHHTPRGPVLIHKRSITELAEPVRNTFFQNLGCGATEIAVPTVQPDARWSSKPA